MRKLKKVAVFVMCAMTMMSFAPQSVLADDGTNETIIYEAPKADGVDLIEGNANARATKQYSSSKFSVGVYLNGAPFTMNSKGTAKFTSANQSAVNTTKQADISYQIIDYYSNKVYSGVRKTGNLRGQTVDASSLLQKNKEVKAYLNNNTGQAVTVSGTFNW